MVSIDCEALAKTQLEQRLSQLAIFPSNRLRQDRLVYLKEVLEYFSIQRPAPLVITVAGTNGKGSTATTIASLLQMLGLKVGLFTSPHLQVFNERIVINQQPIDSVTLLSIFQQIESNINDQLAYFEWAFLSAMIYFHHQSVDVAVLEVGLGGRLDATNTINADIAVITTIDIDHVAQLGNTREDIGHEKAGILRSHIPLVTTESHLPQSIWAVAQRFNCPVYQIGQQFKVQHLSDRSWRYQRDDLYYDLPMPVLAGDHQIHNAATAITAVQLTPYGDLLTEALVIAALGNVKLNGRLERFIYNQTYWWFDVAHNAQGAAILAQHLRQHHHTGAKIWAILAMLKDKDAVATAGELVGLVDHWYFAGLSGNRGQTAVALQEKLLPLLPETSLVSSADTVALACRYVSDGVQPNDTVIIFGSFHAIGEARHYLLPLTE